MGVQGVVIICMYVLLIAHLGFVVALHVTRLLTNCIAGLPLHEDNGALCDPNYYFHNRTFDQCNNQERHREYVSNHGGGTTPPDLQQVCQAWDFARDDLGITLVVQVLLALILAVIALYAVYCVITMTCRWRPWLKTQRRKMAHRGYSATEPTIKRVYRYLQAWLLRTGSPHNAWWMYRSEVFEQVLQWMAFSFYCESGLPRSLLVIFASVLLVNAFSVMFLTSKSPRMQIEVRWVTRRGGGGGGARARRRREGGGGGGGGL
jgi:hypothetical protein